MAIGGKPPPTFGLCKPSMSAGLQILGIHRLWQQRRFDGVYRDQNVGGGLPPMAGYQSVRPSLTHRHRGVSPPPTFGLCKPSMSAGLQILGIHRLGQQRRFDGVYRDQNVGGGLAPDCGVSVSSSVTDPPPSGASPPPTFGLCKPSMSAGLQILGIHRLGQQRRFDGVYGDQNVGGGLPPIAVYQSVRPSLTTAIGGRPPLSFELHRLFNRVTLERRMLLQPLGMPLQIRKRIRLDH